MADLVALQWRDVRPDDQPRGWQWSDASAVDSARRCL